MDYILWDLPSLKIDQSPRFDIDNDTGEVNLNWSGTGNVYQNIPLLYCESGIPVWEVNNWLIHLKANRQRKQVNTQAQALLHYYSFLRGKGMSWDVMPIALRNRPTYQFRKHLKDACLSGKIARSTAKNYIGVVVNFYKFYLAKGYKFENAPFKYEVVKVKREGGHESMRNSHIYVDTSDLRLDLPKSTTFGNVSRRLIPLSEEEWNLVDRIYRVDGTAIQKSSGFELQVPISIEFKLIVALARYTGMRRQELVTFRARLVFKPSEAQLTKKYLVDTEGVYIAPELGVDTKGSGGRTIELPSALMLALHRYTNSNRYIKRREKFEKNNPNEAANPPLFIAQRGTFYTGKTLDARWGEIRNSARKTSQQFDHKFHNLRATYAVSRLKILLNNSLKEGDALDYLQATMGHKHRATLLAYLKFCTVSPVANEIYENAIEQLIGDDFSSLIGSD
ncbi:Site-specific recombinase XerD [Alteromonadaceae bacterium Bs31]|nr:Site-specific recombinase XerD [Alteromonadaceae bacterium Bs31]